jgi:excinuclease ABC subunit B
VIVVATVSCIYGLGAPKEYLAQSLPLRVGQRIDRDELIRALVNIQYQRNDIDFTRGNFRVKGDTVEVIAIYDEEATRIEFFGDEIEKIYRISPLTGEILMDRESVAIYPASYYVAPAEQMGRAIEAIEEELENRYRELEKQQKLLEAQRIKMRTTFDLEMIRELGFCSGIENYSRHIDGREPGEPPACLLDYFPDDFLTVVDESHVTIPQIRAMYNGDSSRKRTLVEYGFRLPSALDNRPLRFDEFLERTGQTVYLSATPAEYELKLSDGVVEQIIRPTGLVDPQIVVKPSKGQIDDLLEEIKIRSERSERVLVTTLTKRLAEEVTEYLTELGIRVRYLHSDVDTLRRVELLRELRQGLFDVLIGINLLREGLDLPEVSLVAILDADKEGFLRSTTSLIQTIGRAARNVAGEVHMYADRVTDSMKRAIDETNRRREKQMEYNRQNNIDPQPLRKKIADITDSLAREEVDTEALMEQLRKEPKRKVASVPMRGRKDIGKAGRDQLIQTIMELDAQMRSCAAELNFELAARIRDEIAELKRELRQFEQAGHA